MGSYNDDNHDRDQNNYSTQYRAENGRQNEPESRRSGRPHYSRAGRAASVFNGIHRRRNKRWSW